MNRKGLIYTGILFLALVFFINACSSSSYIKKNREQPKGPSMTKKQTSSTKNSQGDIAYNKKSVLLHANKESAIVTECEIKDELNSNLPLCEAKMEQNPVRKKSLKAVIPSAEYSLGKFRKGGMTSPMHCLGSVRNLRMSSSPYVMPVFNTEEYDVVYENGFLKTVDKPLSTFSIDVDAASYSNIRRFLMRNAFPPKDAIRIEEMINYFTYNYKPPENNVPFSITAEVGICPWNTAHKLVHIGLQGKKVDTDSLPPGNLVFLIDVSGSMNSPDKLPLLKMALKMLANNLRSQDNIAIVVYAGAAGLVLESTSGNKKHLIISALDKLQAGGSTAGGEGIRLAYKIAKENFFKQGNNRVILATDGDFNVGASSDAEMVRLIEEKRNEGIFLTVLGFGTGNYKDSKMEKLADKGNGNYYYIDNLLEAKKVMINEMGGTLLTIAKDVKIQVEFNPAHVQAYRLIGYENRNLKDSDFNDDKKDAGELGAGHSVTALYEIIPNGVDTDLPTIDKLKYQYHKVNDKAYKSSELLTVKFRYKDPNGVKSKLIERTLNDRLSKKSSENFRFSAAVAGFGMLLRNSEYKGDLTYQKVINMAKSSKGSDTNGYRSEFIRMIDQASTLSEIKG